MGGSTNREGRMEVCVGGRRWRTVCTGSRELAGAVCSQMGYTLEGNSYHGYILYTSYISCMTQTEMKIDPNIAANPAYKVG